MTGKELIKILKRNDWVLDRISGSHHIMIKEHSNGACFTRNITKLDIKSRKPTF